MGEQKRVKIFHWKPADVIISVYIFFSVGNETT